MLIGSNSFAGSSFAKYLLDKKYKVLGVSRSAEPKSIYLPYRKSKNLKNFKFVKINLNKNKDLDLLINLVKKNRIKYIVNFAAQGMVEESWIKPEDWYNTNVTSNSKLINRLSKLKINKYLNFTTPEVYGNTSDQIKENNNFSPSTPYAISRACQDMNLLAYWKFNNFPVVFTRAANIFGPYQQLYRIVTKTIISAKNNIKLDLHGGGSSIRSFIFIEDVNTALIKILFDPKNIGQTYHISTNKFISIKNLVSLILKTLKAKRNLIKIVNERKGKDHGYFLNSSKLRKSYKWKEKYSLEEGINKTINWVENNYSLLKSEKLRYNHKK